MLAEVEVLEATFRLRKFCDRVVMSAMGWEGVSGSMNAMHLASLAWLLSELTLHSLPQLLRVKV